MGQYYSLVAGLPDLLPDDPKLRYSVSEFRAELKDNLSENDQQLIGVFFLKYDNHNLLQLHKNREYELKDTGNLKAADLLEILGLFAETDHPKDKRIVPYFQTFIPALLADQALAENMTWEDQLTSVYYDYATSLKNRFISSWFSMNLHVTNILVAVNCRKYGLNVASSVVGNNEVSESLRTSHAKDFGLLPLFPEVDDVLRIADEEDLFERERKVDLFKWNWLEEHGFFHYFDVERLFIYLVKLDMLERWTKLEKARGQKMFTEMITKMQKAFEFPSEFKLVKIKK